MAQDQIMVFARGIPASGKSTWSQKWVAQDPENRARVNRDDIRYAMYGEYVLTKPEVKNGKPTGRAIMDGEKEGRVSEMEYKLIDAYLKEGKSVVSDNTNVNTKRLKPYLAIAKKHGIRVAHKDFPITKEEAKRRNANRDRKVPGHVIDRMYSGLGPNGEFHQFPGSYPTKPFVKPATREPAAVFDMDGTLSDTRDITHFVHGKFRDFDSFHRHSLFTPPNKEVLAALRSAHEKGYKIVITTARNEEFRGVTQAWLDKLNIPYDNIFMRKDGDSRKDFVVKKEIFDNDINPNYDLVISYDDNPQAVEAWREKGVRVVEVPGFEDHGPDRSTIKVPNVFTSGNCVRCGRSFKGEGTLGPNCKTKVA